METAVQNRSRVSGFALKLIAILTMTIDHTAAVLVEVDCAWYWPMRAVGRIAFPIYCFLLVEGYFHTHSVGKYLRRLLLAAILSEVPFDLAFGEMWICVDMQSVMLTLAIGLAAVYLVDHSREYAQRVTGNTTVQRVLWIGLAVAFAAAGIWLAEVCDTDYSGGGVLLVLLFYLFRKRPVPLCLAVLAELYLCFGWVEVPGVLAMVPILLYNGQRGPAPGGKWGQWFFYAYYPLHIGVLVLIRAALYGAGGLTLGL